MRRYLTPLLLLLLWPLLANAAGEAVQLNIEGPIGPATSDYVSRGLEEAVAQDAAVVILRLDTPGGLDTSMRHIIHDILASPIPVVGYVAPNGARAASAGTYILYACHVAAMAPATNLGAATPISLGAPGTPSPQGNGNDTLHHKVVNDAVAYIQGLAKLRGRNAEWAAKAVREAASLDAEPALKAGVIDLIAKSVPDLLAQIDGRQITVQGKSLTLKTQGLSIQTIEPDWRSKLLSIITDPNVAYILMLIGIYGLIFEFANPGSILPGTVGAICLLLALYAFQVLPINYAGLGLMLLGIALMVAEAFVPSFGALGIGGTVSFIIGSIILMDTHAPGFGISKALIGSVAIFSAVLFMLILGMAVRARRRPVVSGAEEMLGVGATAVEDFETEGNVRAHGELWHARSTAPLRKGQRARVTGREGLTLTVTPENTAKGE